MRYKYKKKIIKAGIPIITTGAILGAVLPFVLNKEASTTKVNLSQMDHILLAKTADHSVKATETLLGLPTKSTDDVAQLIDPDQKARYELAHKLGQYIYHNKNTKHFRIIHKEKQLPIINREKIILKKMIIVSQDKTLYENHLASSTKSQKQSIVKLQDDFGLEISMHKNHIVDTSFIAAKLKKSPPELKAPFITKRWLKIKSLFKFVQIKNLVSKAITKHQPKYNNSIDKDNKDLTKIIKKYLHAHQKDHQDKWHHSDLDKHITVNTMTNAQSKKATAHVTFNLGDITVAKVSTDVNAHPIHPIFLKQASQAKVGDEITANDFDLSKLPTGVSIKKITVSSKSPHGSFIEVAFNGGKIPMQEFGGLVSYHQKLISLLKTSNPNFVPAPVTTQNTATEDIASQDYRQKVTDFLQKQAFIKDLPDTYRSKIVDVIPSIVKLTPDDGAGKLLATLQIGQAPYFKINFQGFKTPTQKAAASITAEMITNAIKKARPFISTKDRVYTYQLPQTINVTVNGTNLTIALSTNSIVEDSLYDRNGQMPVDLQVTQPKGNLLLSHNSLKPRFMLTGFKKGPTFEEKIQLIQKELNQKRKKLIWNKPKLKNSQDVTKQKLLDFIGIKKTYGATVLSHIRAHTTTGTVFFSVGYIFPGSSTEPALKIFLIKNVFQTDLEIANLKLDNFDQTQGTAPTKKESSNLLNAAVPTASDVVVPIISGFSFVFNSATKIDNQGKSQVTYKVNLVPQVSGTKQKLVTWEVPGFETAVAKATREANADISTVKNALGTTASKSAGADIAAVSAGTTFNQAAATVLGISYPSDDKDTTMTYSHGALTADGNLVVTIKINKVAGAEQTATITVAITGINVAKADVKQATNLKALQDALKNVAPAVKVPADTAAVIAGRINNAATLNTELGIDLSGLETGSTYAISATADAAGKITVSVIMTTEGATTPLSSAVTFIVQHKSDATLTTEAADQEIDNAITAKAMPTIKPGAEAKTAANVLVANIVPPPTAGRLTFTIKSVIPSTTTANGTAVTVTVEITSSEQTAKAGSTYTVELSGFTSVKDKLQATNLAALQTALTGGAVVNGENQAIEIANKIVNASTLQAELGINLTNLADSSTYAISAVGTIEGQITVSVIMTTEGATTPLSSAVTFIVQHKSDATLTTEAANKEIDNAITAKAMPTIKSGSAIKIADNVSKDDIISPLASGKLTFSIKDVKKSTTTTNGTAVTVTVEITSSEQTAKAGSTYTVELSGFTSIKDKLQSTNLAALQTALTGGAVVNGENQAIEIANKIVNASTLQAELGINLTNLADSSTYAISAVGTIEGQITVSVIMTTEGATTPLSSAVTFIVQHKSDATLTTEAANKEIDNAITAKAMPTIKSGSAIKIADNVSKDDIISPLASGKLTFSIKDVKKSTTTTNGTAVTVTVEITSSEQTAKAGSTYTVELSGFTSIKDKLQSTNLAALQTALTGGAVVDGENQAIKIANKIVNAATLQAELGINLTKLVDSSTYAISAVGTIEGQITVSVIMTTEGATTPLSSAVTFIVQHKSDATLATEAADQEIDDAIIAKAMPTIKPGAEAKTAANVLVANIVPPPTSGKLTFTIKSVIPSATTTNGTVVTVTVEVTSSEQTAKAGSTYTVELSGFILAKTLADKKVAAINEITNYFTSRNSFGRLTSQAIEPLVEKNNWSSVNDDIAQEINALTTIAAIDAKLNGQKRIIDNKRSLYGQAIRLANMLALAKQEAIAYIESFVTNERLSITNKKVNLPQGFIEPQAQFQKVTDAELEARNAINRQTAISGVETEKVKQEAILVAAYSEYNIAFDAEVVKVKISKVKKDIISRFNTLLKPVEATQNAWKKDLFKPQASWNALQTAKTAAHKSINSQTKIKGKENIYTVRNALQIGLKAKISAYNIERAFSKTKTNQANILKTFTNYSQASKQKQAWEDAVQSAIDEVTKASLKNRYEVEEKHTKTIKQRYFEYRNYLYLQDLQNIKSKPLANIKIKALKQINFKYDWLNKNIPSLGDGAVVPIAQKAAWDQIKQEAIAKVNQQTNHDNIIRVIHDLELAIDKAYAEYKYAILLANTTLANNIYKKYEAKRTKELLNKKAKIIPSKKDASLILSQDKVLAIVMLNNEYKKLKKQLTTHNGQHPLSIDKKNEWLSSEARFILSISRTTNIDELMAELQSQLAVLKQAFNDYNQEIKRANQVQKTSEPSSDASQDED